MENNMSFNAKDEYGNNIKCNVIGMLKNNDKNFVMYTKKLDEEKIYASLYELNNEELILIPITLDEDWDIVDKYLEEI